MTIKQGGVFGRNPTFNTVTTQGSATLAGPLTVNAASVDLDTQIGTLAGPYSFFMDGTNGAVGFGTNSVTPYFGTTVRLYNAGSGATLQVGSSAITAAFLASPALGFAALQTTTAHDLLLATNSTERVRIGATSGNVTLTNGNLVIGTSGKGIDFSATAGTGTSELFSDYEEGTWVPTIIGSATAGTATHDIQVGRYTKVGRLVTVQFSVVWAGGTGSGNLRISGLPFTTSSLTNNYAAFGGYFSNVALTAGSIACMTISPNTGYIGVAQMPTGGGAGSDVPYDAAGTIFASITYEAL